MVNQIALIGHTGRDIEVKTLENGNKVATVTLATTESYKDKNDQWQNLTEWHNIVVWRPSATVEKILKGNLILVQGKITTRKYADKDGVERQRAEIVANLVKMLEPARVGSQHTTDIPSNAIMENSKVVDGPPDMTYGSDDLPF